MFKSQYCTFGGFHNSQVTGYQNLELLKEELDSCMIRRSLKDVRESMPPKTVTTELLEMSDAHKKFYEAIKDGVKEEVDKIQLNSSNLLALTTRLRQATACPSILTTQDIMSTKIERCVELVEDLVEQGEKVVVLSQFKEPVTQLAKLLAKYNPSVNTGDTDDSLVSKNVDLFQNDPNSNVFLGTFGKCSTGLTLNAASYLIALDESWTAAENNQAWDRIWRISNTKPAFITILMCKDSIDERVHQIAQIKQDLSDYVIDDIQNEMSKSLRGELINLLREL
jgi:SNF2 family DNA or RNA helicase